MCFNSDVGTGQSRAFVCACRQISLADPRFRFWIVHGRWPSLKRLLAIAGDTNVEHATFVEEFCVSTTPSIFVKISIIQFSMDKTKKLSSFKLLYHIWVESRYTDLQSQGNNAVSARLVYKCDDGERRRTAEAFPLELILLLCF